jgi:hypothetical protein
MDKAVWLARLLGVGGVLEGGAGLGLLLDPAGGAAALFGASMQEPGLTIGRIGGSGLLALGIACWLARRTPAAAGSVGVGWAYLTYNVITCSVLVCAGTALEGTPLPALGAAVLHGVLGAAVFAALIGRHRPASGP